VSRASRAAPRRFPVFAGPNSSCSGDRGDFGYGPSESGLLKNHPFVETETQRRGAPSAPTASASRHSSARHSSACMIARRLGADPTARTREELHAAVAPEALEPSSFRSGAFPTPHPIRPRTSQYGDPHRRKRPDIVPTPSTRARPFLRRASGRRRLQRASRGCPRTTKKRCRAISGDDLRLYVCAALVQGSASTKALTRPNAEDGLAGFGRRSNSSGISSMVGGPTFMPRPTAADNAALMADGDAEIPCETRYLCRHP